MKDRARSFSIAMAAVVWAGCSGSGTYVWATQLPTDEARPTEYVIATGDVLTVRVYGQDALTTRAKVRTDGKISLPFLGDVAVNGKPPVAVAREVETGLKTFINAPNVVVTVDETPPLTVSVIGEVAHPGSTPIDNDTSLLQVLANAGGLTEYASRNDIYVLRELPVPRRIRFTYDSLTRDPPTSRFRLRRGDVVVVE